MDIDEIKKRLREEVRGNATSTQQNPPQIKQVLYKPQPHPIIDDTLEYGDSSEEEDPPQSKVWVPPPSNSQAPSTHLVFSDPIEFIETYQLNNKVYDWRRKTAKGKKSRKNYRDFIFEKI